MDAWVGWSNPGVFLSASLGLEDEYEREPDSGHPSGSRIDR